MQTRSLRTLVRVSRVGSFVKAAEQLNMTLSALSMQMKALETELGVDLFDRSVRPPRLTPIGRTIVEAAIPLLHREESLLEICRSTDTLVGHFRIGFVTTAAVRLLPDFLKNVPRHAPQATFAFETGLSKALQEKVLSGQLDAALVTDAEGVPDTLAELVLWEEPFVFAAHENLLKDGLAGLLNRHPFFHFMPDTGIGKLIAGEMLRHERPKSCETIVLDNLEAIMECVSAGIGFTLLPAPDVARYRSIDVKSICLPHASARKLVLATVIEGALAGREATLATLFSTDEAVAAED
ncbi:LysR family transcriptional regulator [uncultured Roseovarius sp.]|uniref:LysR family transcriptional regulator n=1 Tax=uncultured Roseovarius sp. TaxID=293344 RepID=UPI00260BDAC8|nr:LysR family transcriptional regulator [uncultured Roseovarius sp.]